MLNINLTAITEKPRPATGILAALSLAALGGAYYFQYVVGLAPCQLCIYQRVPHALVVILACAAMIVARRDKPKLAALFIFICGILSLIGSGIAGYHTGVEQHWWSSFLEACTLDLNTTSGNILEQIQKTTAVRCDAVPWSLFGVSMAGYNAIVSFMMFVFATVSSIMITRRANGF